MYIYVTSLVYHSDIANESAVLRRGQLLSADRQDFSHQSNSKEQLGVNSEASQSDQQPNSASSSGRFKGKRERARVP
jgi:hypothetical protein